MSVGSGAHEFQVADDGIHIPFFATYTNAVNRGTDTRVTGPRVVPGDTGSAFRALATEDLFKIALQTDDNSIYMLTATTPTWQTLFTGDASRIDILVLKGSAGTITKGEVVYASGWDDTAGVPEVELARSDAAATMPAIGVALEDITDSTQGEIRVFGIMTEVDTSSFTTGDPLYVSPSTAGEFVTSRPTGATDLIQLFGEVGRVSATLGSHGVGGSLRANDLPNLTDGKAWQGNSNNFPVEVTMPSAPLSFGDYTLSTSTVIQFLYPNVLDSGLAHTTEVVMSAPRAGTLRSLHVRATAGVGAATITFTLRVEVADTALVVAMSNTVTNASDLVNAVAVSQNDRLSMKVTKSAGVATALTHIQVTLEYAA